jgi:hypothetical protein
LVRYCSVRKYQAKSTKMKRPKKKVNVAFIADC